MEWKFTEKNNFSWSSSASHIIILELDAFWHCLWVVKIAYVVMFCDTCCHKRIQILYYKFVSIK